MSQANLAIAPDGAFSGHAAIFAKPDLGGDVIQPGAFAASLARGPAKLRLLFMHDAKEPIGLIELAREDSRGLFVRGRLLPGVQRAREVHALVTAGALDGLSIGFKTVRSRRDPRTGLRLLQAVDLWEISLVTFPMMPEARLLRIWTPELIGKKYDPDQPRDKLGKWTAG
jgi:uncharacterized protein